MNQATNGLNGSRALTPNATAVDVDRHDTWKATRKLLCIRLDYLGDVLMTTPALRALKQGGERHLTLLTSAGGAAASAFLPEVDETLTYGAPWLKHGGSAEPARDLELIKALRAHSFDGAVIFTVYSQNPLPAAMLCHLAGIPLRLAHCRENPYQLLTDWVPETEPHRQVRHEVQRQLDLVAHVGMHCPERRLSFRVPAADQRAVDATLDRLGIDARQPFVVLHPGASAASRRYPAAQWREVAFLLAKAPACPLVFTGSSDEADLINGIYRNVPLAHSLAGTLDLGCLGALIARAPLLISNNTGPVHLAAALGTPVVDLYALTNPQHTPWQVPSRVLFNDVACRYCYKSVCPKGHHACLAGVMPAQVAEAARDLLAGRHAIENNLPAVFR